MVFVSSSTYMNFTSSSTDSSKEKRKPIFINDGDLKIEVNLRKIKSTVNWYMWYIYIFFSGPRCSQCATNYFGNPTEPGGSCRPCECSGNIAVNVPGSCDPITGQCLKCLHNTEGYYCDVVSLKLIQ